MSDRDRLYTHVEDGGIYHLVDDRALLKDEATSAWVKAIWYQDADPRSPRYGQTYTTLPSRWITRFRRLPAPPTPGGKG